MLDAPIHHTEVTPIGGERPGTVSGWRSECQTCGTVLRLHDTKDEALAWAGQHGEVIDMDDEPTYKVTRFFEDPNLDSEIIETGLTKQEAQAHCYDPETSSSTCTEPEGLARTEQFGRWFDGWDEE